MNRLMATAIWKMIVPLLWRPIQVKCLRLFPNWNVSSLLLSWEEQLWSDDIQEFIKAKLLESKENTSD
jgi:hypothetical protein